MTLRGSEPVILNGERIYVVVESNKRPWYIPGFIWKWMVRTVVKSQKVSTQHNYTKLNS